MNGSGKKRVITFIATAVWLAAIWLTQFGLAESTTTEALATLVQAVAPTAAGISCWRAARRTGESAWRGMAVGCAMWTIGSIIWTYYVVFQGDSLPFPSFADVGYLLLYPPAIVGALWFHETRPRGADRVRSLLDALLVAGSLTVILWWALLASTHRGQGVLEPMLSVSYVVGDIVVVSLIASAIRRSAGRRPDLLWIIAGFAFLTAADALFAYQEATATYLGGWLPDFSWIAGFALIACAAARGAQPSAAPQQRRWTSVEGWRYAVIYGPYLAAVSVTAFDLVRDRMLDGTQAWAAIALAVIAFARQVAAQAENTGLTTDLEARLDDLTRSHVQLTASQSRFRAAFDHAPIGMVVIDADGTVNRLNEALVAMFGGSQRELLGRRFVELAHVDDRRVVAQIVTPDELGESTTMHFEVRLARGDASIIWTRMSAVTIHAVGEPSYVIAQIEDITERREIARTLEHNARHDPLTGLANRTLFKQALTEALSCLPKHTGLAVAFVDVDRFKMVNDSLGHDAGDVLLRVIAERLLDAARDRDLVARFGGDEFTLLLHDVPDSSAALAIADRLEQSLRRPVTIGGVETYVTASVGVAVAGPLPAGVNPGEAADHLLRDADTAMYLAKESGRSRTELFDEQRDRGGPKQLTIANALHRAIERDEFRVFYQPVVDARSGVIFGFEALLRWEHAPGQFMAPAEFIGVAEDTGLIVPIGAWVMRSACRQAARWNEHASAHDQPAITVSVNLSPRQFDAGDLVQTVQDALAATSLSPDLLWLEITESALMRDTASTIATLREIRRFGVHFSIDDFGTGYSSLSYLKRFPVEALKIDQSFTDGLGTDPEDTAIVTAVIGLAHALNLRAIAEGVETPAQYDDLRRLGCDGVQGYHFGRPTSRDDLGDDPRAPFTDPDWLSTTGWGKTPTTGP